MGLNPAKLDSLADKINEEAERDALKAERAKNKVKEEKKTGKKK